MKRHRYYISDAELTAILREAFATLRSVTWGERTGETSPPWVIGKVSSQLGHAIEKLESRTRIRAMVAKHRRADKRVTQSEARA